MIRMSLSETGSLFPGSSARGVSAPFSAYLPATTLNLREIITPSAANNSPLA